MATKPKAKRKQRPLSNPRHPRRPTVADTGHHTALTDELQAKICDLIKLGNYIEPAVRSCGISKVTFYAWLKKGQAGIQPYENFLNAVEVAEQEGEVMLVNQARQFASTDRDSRTIMEILSRRYRKNWAKSDKLEVGTPDGQAGKLEIKMTFGDTDS